MVVDFKRLNSVIISDTYPIPDIASILAIDRTLGFHQMAMNPKDIRKMVF